MKRSCEEDTKGDLVREPASGDNQPEIDAVADNQVCIFSLLLKRLK